MTITQTAGEFLNRTECAVAGHYEAANALAAWSRWTTAATIGVGILVVVAGGVLLGDLPLTSETIRALNIAVFFAGVVATTISVFQAVYCWSERSRKHKELGARYADSRRRLELIILSTPMSLDDLSRWSDDYTSIGEGADLVPSGLWRRAIKKLEKKQIR